MRIENAHSRMRVRVDGGGGGILFHGLPSPGLGRPGSPGNAGWERPSPRFPEPLCNLAKVSL